MINNIYELLADAVSKNSDKLFFIRQNETYSQLFSRVKKRAVMLRKKFGIKKDDVVGILCGNTPDFIVSYFATVSIGARALMLDSGLNSQEHINMLNHTNAKICLSQKSYFNDGSNAKFLDIENLPDEEFDESEFIPEDVEPSDIAQISFTSGSTGNPKVVGLMHSNLLGLARAFKRYDPIVRPGDIVYGFLPLYHIYGTAVNIIAPLSYSASVLLQPVLNPREFLKDFEQYKPHVIPCVPRVMEGFYKKIIDTAKEKKVWWLMRFVLKFQGILKVIGLGFLVNKIKEPVHKIFGGRMKLMLSGGATLKPTVRKFFEAFDLAVGDGYGLTETTSAINFNLKFRMRNGRMHYAAPLMGNEIKIVNQNVEGIGEIWCRGSMVMPGYMNNPTANAEAFEDGWFKTGDLGVLDSRGRLTIKGRQKQIIVLDSGKNVYPDELEELYMQNDAILAAAVFERVIKDKMVAYAVFQVKPGTTLNQVSLLVKASNLTIAPYKWVSHFAITEDELPMTSARKIKHFQIREMLERGEYPNHN